MITVVPIVIGVAITAAKPGPATASGSSFKPVAPSPTAAAPATTSTHSKKSVRQPGVLVALLQHATTMRTSPDGPTLAPLPMHTEFGSPQALSVVRRSGSLSSSVVSPLAGNNKLGWIDESAVKLGRVTWRINVSLTARRLDP